MAKLNYFLFVIIFLCIASAEETGKGYYWKEYTGVIPPDAIPGGKDLDGQDTFIGQAYFHKHGLYVVQIFPGKMDVKSAWWGVKKTNNDIKILCSENPENFDWVYTTFKTFYQDTKDTYPVPGGYDFVNNEGIMHIGRLRYQGVVKTGGIWSFKRDNAGIYFDYNDALKRATMYEALVYNKP